MLIYCVALAAACVACALALAVRVWRNAGDRLRPHEWLCIGLGIYYGGGALAAFAGSSAAEVRQMIADAGTTEVGIVHALMVVLGFMLLLNLGCALFPRETGIDTRLVLHALEHFRSSQKSGLFFACVLGLEVVLIATGKIGFAGVQTEEDSYRVSSLAMLIQPFGLAVLFIGGYLIGAEPRKIWRLLPFLAQFAIHILLGRRVAVAAIAVAGLGYLLSRPNWRYGICAVALAASLCMVAFPVFLSMRVAKSGFSEKPDLKDLVAESIQVLRSGQGPNDEILKEQLAENLRSRPFIIGFLAGLCSSPRRNAGSMGDVTIGAVAGALPSVLFPMKIRWMARGAEERVAEQQMGMYWVEDEANSILTAAYTDARELGVLLLVPLVMGWIALVTWFVRYSPVPEFRATLFCCAIFTPLYVEQALTGWFVGLRDALILFLVSIAIGWILEGVRRWPPHAMLKRAH